MGRPDAYALDATCGAPPDEFNPRGQDWGLPPYSPRALRAAGYQPFVELLRANMPQGGALRMDHVMALARLYWIPPAKRRTKAATSIIRSTSCWRCSRRKAAAIAALVIGEDLGTVTGGAAHER